MSMFATVLVEGGWGITFGVAAWTGVGMGLPGWPVPVVAGHT